MEGCSTGGRQLGSKTSMKHTASLLSAKVLSLQLLRDAMTRSWLILI